jgi:signal transduction histidine kinase
MAEAAGASRAVFGRVDSADRLVHAEPELAALQEEAGGAVGGKLLLPQVSAVVRLARELEIAVTRRAMAAGAQNDVEFWVTATPEGDEIALSIDRWSFRPPAPPRLEAILSGGAELRPNAAASWSADERLRLTALSPDLATILSLAPGEALGQPLTRIFRLEEDESGDLPILTAAAAQDDFSGQMARPRGGGEPLLTLSATAVHTAGRFEGYQGLVSIGGADSGEGTKDPHREAVESALDDALRSPLGKIIRSAVRIAQRSDGPLRGDYASYASDIAAAAKHLMEVMTSMSGDTAADRKVVDLALLADESAGLLSSAADEKGVRVVIRSNGPLMAQGDRSAVIQVLVNLIGNALRYSPGRSEVVVSLERKDGFAEVHVRDRGPGIDPIDHERIFERFEKAAGSIGNTGLGLAISRRLARAMGGEILVESKPGDGSCFILRLLSAS